MALDIEEVKEIRVENKNKRNKLEAQHEKEWAKKKEQPFFRIKSGYTYKVTFLSMLILVLSYYTIKIGLFNTILLSILISVLSLIIFSAIVFRIGEGRWGIIKQSTKNIMFPSKQDRRTVEKSDKKPDFSNGHSHSHPWDSQVYKLKKVTKEDLKNRRGLFGTILVKFHAYIYTGLIYTYIHVLLTLAPYLPDGFREHFAATYHGKVLTVELAKQIILNDVDIPRCDVGETILPYPFARDLVLSSTPYITMMDCACRLARTSHCEPTKVCMSIAQNKIVQDFILDHLPTAKAINQEEAVQIIEEEHKRGHVHTAYFKDAVNDRFYCICNCCKCCCGGIQMMAEWNVPMITSSGYVAHVDPNKCVACGKCYTSCPFNAISYNESLDDEDIVAVIDRDICMGCTACEAQCEYDALSFEIDATKPKPLDIKKIVMHNINDW